jgi:signal transduction histidine kinase
VKSYSITRRLIATVLVIELISALCVTAVAWVYERHAHFHAFDVLLLGRADSMLGAVQDAEDANDNVMLDGTEINVPPDDVYEVADASGRILGRSSNWQGSAASVLKGRGPKESHGPGHEGNESFYEMEIHGIIYRVIRLQGLRIVDPGDKGGGVRRYVAIYYGSSVRRVWSAVMRSVSFYAISSLLVLACTGILMTWLLKRGLAPLHELAASASRVSVTSWSFQPPQEARKTRELAPLVAALEALLGGLQLSFEQQKRFVGDAAHELKTSVAVVKSSLQLLSMKERSAKEYQAGLERCLTDCERMESIVAQMLTLARLEEEIAPESAVLSTEIFPCLKEVVQELQAMTEMKGISIRTDGELSLMATIEAEQFKLLCTNLLMNALQHSPFESVIEVEIKQEGFQVEMFIRDRGEGIAAEDIPHIFDRFSRSDPSRNRKTGGTGLGLAICKAVVDRIGGTIVILSDVNAGTTVVVQLPVAKNVAVRA